MDGPAWAATAGSLGLSKRQIQVVQAVFDDDTEFAIAEKFSISQHTVHTHFERIYRKLEVRDRVQLVLRVVFEFLKLTADQSSELPPICCHATNGKCPVSKSDDGS